MLRALPATIRLARPSTAFCSCNTTGILRWAAASTVGSEA